ncbi:hypothetical protein GCM10007421_12790 [Halopseudomonas oceani]|jgi:hypothetical protein|uniref:MFS transporter n=1 Tax=Halopseudomonas oceani TaxID=1708783 RepID=A0A2P4ERK8_9GAMM|nr:MFS transporter [Halopseudomonas oceani]POB01437.1 MFS transporter [Halopseudomonas oceani]GGE40229.1 hypothetical protein GCM10007421_12790 [Halopseudomonas oceani]
MFNEAEYQTVWWIYLATAAGCWLVWWKMTALTRWWFIREPLCLAMGVLLFTPVAVEADGSWMAPALLIYLLDTFLSTGENQARALGELGMMMSLAFTCYVPIALVRVAVERWWRRRHPREEEEPAAADA